MTSIFTLLKFCKHVTILSIMENLPQKKLNEKELGSLYLISATPLHVDKILKKNDYGDDHIAAIHHSLSAHAPDMAMIGIALCGNILAEALKKKSLDVIEPLATELKYLSINTLEEVGRIWIDACHYGIDRPDDIEDIVTQSPDILCMFASIFMEIAEACTPEPDIFRAVAASLMYQCEAHADSARSLLENADPKPSKTAIEDIPLPPELQAKSYTDNVVTFTLFGEQKGQ